MVVSSCDFWVLHELDVTKAIRSIVAQLAQAFQFSVTHFHSCLLYTIVSTCFRTLCVGLCAICYGYFWSQGVDDQADNRAHKHQGVDDQADDRAHKYDLCYAYALKIKENVKCS